MIIRNAIIDSLDQSQLNSVDVCHISNSIINTIDLVALELDFQLIIEHSIVSNFLIHTCWFKKGLIFKNNQVLNYIDYQMGGHNEENIVIADNIFCGFFNFFDCYFTGNLTVKNNIFIKGSNLIGNVNEGWKNSFKKELVIENNMGLLDMSGIGQ